MEWEEGIQYIKIKAVDIQQPYYLQLNICIQPQRGIK